MNTEAPLVAILDDEPQIRMMLADSLNAAGYRTANYARATEFEAALRRTTPDVCLVDLGLPDKDGLALVHKLALESGSAIIIISGRAQVQDKVAAFDLGADDYVIKPFDPAEIVVRVRALLRRGRPTPTGTKWIAHFEDWIADFNTFSLEDSKGKKVAFSHAEGEVLRLFLESPNRLMTRAYMQETLGGLASESFDRAMDVRISRLRTKLGEDPKNPKLIKTIYGAGYIFIGEVIWQ